MGATCRVAKVKRWEDAADGTACPPPGQGHTAEGASAWGWRQGRCGEGGVACTSTTSVTQGWLGHFCPAFIPPLEGGWDFHIYTSLSLYVYIHE